MKRFWKWLEEFARRRQDVTVTNGLMEPPRPWPVPPTVQAPTGWEQKEELSTQGFPKRSAMSRYNWSVEEDH